MLHNPKSFVRGNLSIAISPMVSVFVASLFVFAAIVANTSPAFAQFGTGTDIYWAQSNGNPTAGPTIGVNSSDPASGFSVDGLWDDNLSTGYTSSPVPAGTYPSINWSTSSAGTPVPSTIPGTYPGTSPNATDPGYIPGSPGNTNVDIVFDATDGYNSPTAIELNYSPTVQGIYFTNIGANTEIHTDTATDPQTITLGSDGLNIENTVGTSPVQAAGATPITIGATTIGTATYAPLTINLSGSQTWLNSTGSGSSKVEAIAVTSPITVASTVTSPILLTLSDPLDGSTATTNPVANNHINGQITDNTGGGGVLSIVATSGQWTFGAAGTPPAASTFTGGVTIDSGAQVKVIYPTGAGTGTITVNNGGTLILNTTASTHTTWANPIMVSGVGTPGPGDSGTGITTYTTSGAINSTNTNGTALTELDDASGGVTLTGDTLVEAMIDPLTFSALPVNLDYLGTAHTLTISANGATRIVSILSPILDGGLGGGLTVNSGSSFTSVLAGSNNYSGTTTIQSGGLAINAGGNTGGGAYVVMPGTGSSTLTIDTPGVVTASTISLGGGTFLDLNNGKFSLKGDITFSSGTGAGNVNFNAGTLLNGNSGSTPITIHGGLAMIVNSGGATIDTTGGNITSNASIVGGTSGGVGVLTVQGGNTLFMNSTAGNFNGGIDISGATVSAGGNSNGTSGSLGADTDPITIEFPPNGSSSSLVIGGGFTVANPITVTGFGSGTLSLGGSTANPSAFAGGSIALSSGLTISQVTGGTVRVADGITTPGTQTLTFAPAANTTAVGPAVAVTGAIGGGGGTINLVQNGPGTTNLSGTNTFNGSTVTVTTGTLEFSNATAPTITGTVSVSVAPTGTLQLAGAGNALSGAVNIATGGTGAGTDGAVSVTGVTNQTVGTITGTGMPDVNNATVFSGNTTVGDGNNPATLTATQILQNSLIINAGSTVTILPSAGPDVAASSASASVASSATSASAASTASSDAGGSDSSGSGSSSSSSSGSSSSGSGSGGSDPLAAIQAAIASGAVSSTTGQILEDRIAAIAQMSAIDPGLNVSLLDNRVMNELAVFSSESSYHASMLALDSSSFAASSASGLGGLGSVGSFSGSPAAVPEPSTLLLAAFGALGIAFALRHRIAGAKHAFVVQIGG